MANFRISSSGPVGPGGVLAPGTSPSQNAPTGVAFFGASTPGPDTLIVDQGAFLISNTDSSGRGAELYGPGAWTVTVNGFVAGTQVGLYLFAFNPDVSKITIGKEGSVLATGIGSYGIAADSAATISNAGTISGDYGIAITQISALNAITNTGTITGITAAIADLTGGLSKNSVTNFGTINGAVNLAGGDDTLTNSGKINGNVDLGADNDTMTNKGFLTGNVALGEGNNKFTHSGTLSGDVTAGAGNDTVVNKGFIGAELLLGDGNNTVTNSGTIAIDVVLGTGNDIVTNSKTISQGVQLGDGANSFTNTGSSGSLEGGLNVDKIVNSGTIDGVVDLFDGNDVFTNFLKVGKKIVAGSVVGQIDLGDGNDTFKGGAKGETVQDGNGADTIILGSGNDTYIATGNAGTDGTDIVNGGKGIDTYNASATSGTSPLTINLDSVNHAEPTGLSFYDRSAAANTAQGVDTGSDTISGFENATGGSGQDVIFGSASANVIEGGADNDDLFGFGGNDTIDGGTGQDFIVGGAGKDILTGGANPDRFWYFSVSDSGVTAATRDVIKDFGADFIDLSQIDANTTNGPNTNDAFSFIGTNENWGGNAGELRAYWTATGQIVEGDVNGDSKADFSIEIFDPTHAITFSATNGTDFFL